MFSALVLGVTLGGASLFAAPAASVPAPTGVVLEASHAMLGTDIATNGTSVFDGDRLATDNVGSLRLRFGSSQAFLTPLSTAIIHPATQGFAADLTSGTIVVASAQGEPFHALADGASVVPANGQPTVGQVTMISANELVFTSRKGALEVAIEGQMKTIPRVRPTAWLFSRPTRQRLPRPPARAATTFSGIPDHRRCRRDRYSPRLGSSQPVRPLTRQLDNRFSEIGAPKARQFFCPACLGPAPYPCPGMANWAYALLIRNPCPPAVAKI